MSNSLREATNLALEANKLLDDLNILNILEQYCVPKLIGSVPAGLVVDLDIDISGYIDRNLTINEYMGLAKQLVEIPEVKVLRIRDQRDNPNYSPFKLNIDKLTYQDKNWNIAISFIAESYSEENPNQRLIQELKTTSDENKKLILKLKRDLLSAGDYKIPSFYIYRGVLSNKVKSLEELKEFTEKFKHET